MSSYPVDAKTPKESTMRVMEGRLDVRLISPNAMRDYLRSRRLKFHGLAEAGTRRGVHTSQATVGHIITRKVRHACPERARAIAEVRDVPVRMLCIDEVSIVQRDVPRTRAA